MRIWTYSIVVLLTFGVVSFCHADNDILKDSMVNVVKLSVPKDFTADVCKSKIWDGKEAVWGGVEDLRDTQVIANVQRKDNVTPVKSEVPMGGVFNENLKKIFKDCGVKFIKKKKATANTLYLSVTLKEFYVGTETKVVSAKSEAKSQIIINQRRGHTANKITLDYNADSKHIRSKDLKKLKKALNELLLESLINIPAQPALKKLLQMGPLILAAIILLMPSYYLIKSMKRAAKRKELMDAEFPANWISILNENVALYRYLPKAFKSNLHGYIQIFIAEKNFEGCGGLELSDEMKVTIAGEACILLLKDEKPTFFPRLDSILIYPSAYVAEKQSNIGLGTKEVSVRLGESWSRGIVVLAWDHVRQKTVDFEGGHNVVLHEFAHQLDQENSNSMGVPILHKGSSYQAWGRILGHDYDELRNKLRHHQRDIIDPYGATNPAEFFAVATEVFFEKAKMMRQKHPNLYEELKELYQLDPAEWF